MRATGGGEHDFVGVATPPYRYSNPRDLTTSYGLDARQVVEWDTRAFGFVTTEAEYAALAEAVEFLLWRPNDMGEAVYAAASDSVRAGWNDLLERTGRGEFRITGAEVNDPAPGRPLGTIERVAFDVVLCTPGAEP